MVATPAQLVEYLLSFGSGTAKQSQFEFIQDALFDALGLEGDENLTFFEESAALYWRRVLDVYKIQDISDGYGLAVALLQTNWLRRCLDTTSGGRFAREFPAEHRQLSSLVLDHISRLLPQAFEDDAVRSDLLPFTTLFNSTVSNPRLFVPQLTLPFSESTWKGLRQRMPSIQHLIDDPPFPLQPRELVSLTNLSDIVRNGSDWTPAGVEGEFVLAWRSCELLRDGSDREVKEGLVRCGEGVEMMACGRCLAVRYCCREHQKAHWKRHKLFCFKPEW